MEDHQFAWILWYIWKGRNTEVFSNMDVDPLDTLKLAEMESKLWAEAQILIDNKRTPTGRGNDSSVNSRKMVFHGWFLERE